MNEKVSLKLVRAAGVPQTSSRRKAFSAIAVLALLLTWHIALPLIDFEDISDAFRWHEAISRSQCPQVDPLRPQHRREELLKMEHYLASDDFRNASIARLSGAVQIPTESYDDLGEVGKDKRWEIFFDFAAYLEKTYPLVHQTLQLDKVNTHGLAYTWLGSNITRKPLLLMAHQDVVPVAQDTIGSWTHPPYSGFYDGKLIWGRGSSDCKNSLTGILEGYVCGVNDFVLVSYAKLFAVRYTSESVACLVLRQQ
jgi:Gly-Xaa carboxypeptidase